MSEQNGLLRQLGFWDALTIGVGTMIGAGIFLLSGVAVSVTGPAAIFSYLAAGLICVITAASTAELATGMPTSGGDYYFVSRALGPLFGAISGIGIWLSLTFAIAFYLFGLGEYLAQFTPVTPFWGALGGGLLLVALNIIGAKESGRLQVAIVLILLVILGGFSGLATFSVERQNFTPFFPFGTSPLASTTALVFVSFLGFVKIAAVAEEIKDPAKNLPRTLIGSVVLVTLLYVIIVLIIAGLFPQETIGAVRDPLTAAARSLLGPFGAGVIIFAGLLATLSSANASIFAASRINLAMARDRMVPNWLAAIHPQAPDALPRHPGHGGAHAEPSADRKSGDARQNRQRAPTVQLCGPEHRLRVPSGGPASLVPPHVPGARGALPPGVRGGSLPGHRGLLGSVCPGGLGGADPVQPWVVRRLGTQPRRD
ncbi:MAG: APC family permease [Bacteroidota bacterium]